MLQITNSVKLVLAGLTFVVAALCLPVQVNAQRVEDYLRKADLNDDGKITQSEMTRPIKRYMLTKGYDVTKDHQIADIVEKISESKSSKTSPKTSSKGKGELKVPKFGVDPKEKKNVGAFGATTAKPVEYSEAVTSRTQNTFDRYDVNSNGTLEGSEIEKVRWGSPSPSVSDKNGDGRLSFQEMQERFRERETAQQRSGRSSSDADQGRGRGDSSSGGGSSSGRGGGRGWFNRSGNSSRFSGGSRNSRDDDDDDDDESLSRKNSRSASSGRLEQAERYVEGFLKKYDLDENGVIEGEELEKLTSKAQAKNDKDRNGKITEAEIMAVAYPSPNKSKSVTPAKSSTNRNTSRSRNSRSKTSSAFNKADVDKDRLVQMHEFSKKWTQKKLDEFLDKDTNGDGVISPDEW